MGATQSSDWGFSPKVWQDHISAYFSRKLAYGAFAAKDDSLKSAPGETVNFPYYKSIGAAEEPAQDENLSVDRLQDDSFSATVKEVGKAVGFKKKAWYASADRKESIIAEATRQIARVHAEKVDSDLLTEMNTSGNYIAGVVASTTSDVANINNIATAKIKAFGDKHTEAVAIFMHSFHVLSLLTDSTAGFLKADAQNPWYSVPGYQGSLLGMAVIQVDTLPRVTDISGKQAFACFMVKPNAYGILMKQEMDMEDDYDMLAREYVVAATQWYAVKAFHAKVSANDLRICRSEFCTGISA